jgi:rRNA maturation protein Nop10
MNVFTISGSCPVCGGAANARFHRFTATTDAHMKRKCVDCGFTWEQKAVPRSL